jgi:heavy metal sensor kinase
MTRLRRMLEEGWGHLRTIRVRLTLWYVALLAVTLLAFGVFLYFNLSRNLHDEADQSLALDARRLIATLDIEDGRPRLIEGPESLRPGTIAALYDPTGRRLLADQRSLSPPTMSRALLRAAQGQQTLTTVGSPDGARWRALTGPVVEDNRRVAVLLVARNQRDVEAVLAKLLALMAIAVPVTLLIAVAGGFFLAGRALNPIDRITRTAARIGAEDLSGRLDLAESDELGRLAATFDQMLDRLEAAFQRQRQFTADASHELRTPLAMIVSQIDLALQQPRAAAEYRSALESLREDATRLSRLTSELLNLARADAGRQTLDREPLNLRTIIEEVLESMQPLAHAVGVTLARRMRTDLMLAGDQTRLTQLLVNLVDNALENTPRGGSVTVEAESQGRRAVVSVRDTGVGIAPDHLPHIFERFYRAETARSRAAGGVGLGLAICRWIVEAHGGDIEVTSRVGHGTTVTVHLPVVVPIPAMNEPEPAR